ncbi:hypothetical protein LDL77_06380 [Flagellimonas marinaquae]|uniref:hypothetical protein n=1 Tax=Flagellimonas aurea TaxID=2915619 RepID=UPI001CE11CF6|nr:hypothetical protein LDL77_06380 [Allomuricauda aquimarina]
MPDSNEVENNIPKEISNDERIVRSIFSPIYLNKSNKLRASAFKSPAELDEVSVNRLEFTDADFCKRISKQIENPEFKKNYFGLAVLLAREIRSVDSDVVYSPISEPEDKINPYHSDIKIGVVRKKGEQLPAEYQLKVNKLTSLARLYEDSSPTDESWKGPELK